MRCYSAEREAGTPLVSWGSCAPGPQGPSSSYNTSPHLQCPSRSNKSGDGKARGAKPQKHPPSLAKAEIAFGWANKGTSVLYGIGTEHLFHLFPSAGGVGLFSSLF